MPAKIKLAHYQDFDPDYRIVEQFAGNQTRLGSNNNKYYCCELIMRPDSTWYVYTQFGRVSEEGTTEVYGPMFETEARKFYEAKRRDKLERKTDPYTPVSLASAKIGSIKARGASVGEIDAETKKRMTNDVDGKPPAPKSAPKPSVALDSQVRRFIGTAAPRFLISAPTLIEGGSAATRTRNALRAMASALQVIHAVNDQATKTNEKLVTTVLLPGLGGGAAKISAEQVAEQIHVAYLHFLRGHFSSWEEMDEALAEVIGESKIDGKADVVNA